MPGWISTTYRRLSVIYDSGMNQFGAKGVEGAQDLSLVAKCFRNFMTFGLTTAVQ